MAGRGLDWRGSGRQHVGAAAETFLSDRIAGSGWSAEPLTEKLGQERKCREIILRSLNIWPFCFDLSNENIHFAVNFVVGAKALL